MPVNNQYNLLPPDQSRLSDKGTIRETLLKEKESFEVGEADGRKEDCSAESKFIVFASL